MGAHHPECPERLSAINDQLVRSGLELVLRHYEAPCAQRKHLLRVHDDDYVSLVLEQEPHKDFRFDRFDLLNIKGKIILLPND